LPEKFNVLQFDFYGNMDHKAQRLLLDNPIENVRFHGALNKAGVLNEISNSDYCLMFTAPDYSFGFNTKLLDYLYLRKPIIYFGYPGKVSEYLLKNNIGELFSPEQLEERWFCYLKETNKEEKKYNLNVDISEFEINHLTDKLIKVLNG